MYECGLCPNIYFLDKDFIHHHQKSHRCQICVERKHAELAKKKRISRTGWGCGFCCRFDRDWTERCNHISWHFEKNGDTMANWKHSHVILALLQRPEILPYWNHLLYSKQRFNPRFGWNQHTTGRVEGYPEANPHPQLQDLLEFYTPEQSAEALVRLAYDKGLLRKELPRPPVPPKDYATRPQQSTTLQDLLNDTETLNRFLSTIVEDDVQPTGVCTLDYEAMNEAFDPKYHSFV